MYECSRPALMEKMKSMLLFLAVPLLALAGGYSQTGAATFYADRYIGEKTTSGEAYDLIKMTAAHATLPLHSYVKVQNLGNGRSVVLKINDRMSRKSRYIIDVSAEAARELGLLSGGKNRVELKMSSKAAAEAALTNKIEPS